MSIYLYLGKEQLSGFVMSLRRSGYTAYLELDAGSVYLITDYTLTGSNFAYIGERIS